MDVYVWRSEYALRVDCMHKCACIIVFMWIIVCVLGACRCVSVWECAGVCACGVCKQPEHFDIPMSVSSGVKSVGGSDQTHAESLQALTLLLSIHLSPLLSHSPVLFSPPHSPSFHCPCLSSYSAPLYLMSADPFSPWFPSSFCLLSLSLLSITLCFHHILFFSCGWWMLMNLWISAWGGPLPRGTKMISQPAVWNMGLWRNRVGAQSSRQLFCSGPFSVTEGVVHLK